MKGNLLKEEKFRSCCFINHKINNYDKFLVILIIIYIYLARPIYFETKLLIFNEVHDEKMYSI